MFEQVFKSIAEVHTPIVAAPGSPVPILSHETVPATGVREARP